MNRNRNLFFVAGILLLLGLALVVGEVVGSWRRGSSGSAETITSTPDDSVLASGDFFSQEFAASTEIVPVSGLAVGGLSDELLKTGVWNALLDYERRQGCADLTSRAISVEQINEAGSYWVEDWTVDACGKTQTFRVRFKPDQVGGTIYEISRP